MMPNHLKVTRSISNGKGGTTATRVPNEVVLRLVVDKGLRSEGSNNFPESRKLGQSCTNSWREMDQ